jgi:hypothetical protein
LYVVGASGLRHGSSYTDLLYWSVNIWVHCYDVQYYI